MELDIYIAFSLYLVGFLYASVGHGGASGYIAVLSLFTIPVTTYKPLILILNILVAGVGFYQFWQAGYFRWKLCRVFLVTSIPAAFIGSKYSLEGNIYHLLLGLALILPIIKLLGIKPNEDKAAKPVKLIPALLIGTLIGGLSGMLNIGGGIFLSPVLILLGWANVKEAAAASAIFIVLNSLSGLLGSAATLIITPSAITWFIMAAAGGITGAYWGSSRFQHITVRYLLSAVLTIASVKLLFFM
ncbi:Sulfite exporter TauE/SafE [compost metagenome]